MLFRALVFISAYGVELVWVILAFFIVIKLFVPLFSMGMQCHVLLELFLKLTGLWERCKGAETGWAIPARELSSNGLAAE